MSAERPGLPARLLRRGSRLAADVERALYRYGLLSPARVPFPDFLGIGAQKAGTTWLHENLRRHPELFLPEEKELHYFDRQWVRPLRHYSAAFREAGGWAADEKSCAT